MKDPVKTPRTQRIGRVRPAQKRRPSVPGGTDGRRSVELLR